MKTMVRVLQVSMPDETVWQIPILVIHRNRCEHVASRDNITLDEALTQEEYALKDRYELKDWAANNMNWSDVVLQAVQVHRPPTNYQKAWTNADMEIIEIDGE